MIEVKSHAIWSRLFALHDRHDRQTFVRSAFLGVDKVTYSCSNGFNVITGNPGLLESSILGSSWSFSCDCVTGKDVLDRRGFFVSIIPVWRVEGLSIATEEACVTR